MSEATNDTNRWRGLEASLGRIWAGLILIACSTIVAAENLPLDSIKLPPGFQIAVYAANVPNARSMTLGREGTLFVGTMKAGNVYALVDRNKRCQTAPCSSRMMKRARFTG